MTLLEKWRLEQRERERRTGDGCYDLMYSNCTVLYCIVHCSSAGDEDGEDQEMVLVGSR